MDRRQFFITAGKAFPVAAGAIYLVSCSGTSPTGPLPITPTPTPVPSITATSTSSLGHTHDESVPQSDLSSLASQTTGGTTFFVESFSFDAL